MKIGLSDYAIVARFGLLISKDLGGHARKQSQVDTSLYCYGESVDWCLCFVRSESANSTKKHENLPVSGKNVRCGWREFVRYFVYLRARLDPTGLASL